MMNDGKDKDSDIELLSLNERKQGEIEQLKDQQVEIHYIETQEALTYAIAIKKIFTLAIWPIIGNLLHPAYHIINSIVLGRYSDPIPLAAMSLGATTVSMFILSFGIPFIGALDTLITQAFGQKDLRLCWVYLNKQLFLTTIILLPICMVLFIFCEISYLAIGQSPEIARQASIFVRYTIPGVLLNTWSSCYIRFLYGQRITSVGMHSNIMATITHLILIYCLTIRMDLQMHGIGISTCVQNIVRLLVVLIYMKVTRRFDENYVSFTHSDNRKNLRQQFFMSIQAASLGIWGWWAFNVFTIMASLMTVTDLAANAVIRNIALLSHMIPVGISQSAAILTGNMIGMKNIQAAKMYSYMCTFCTFICALGSIIIMNLMKHQFVSFFTSSANVSTLILNTVGILSFFILFDCMSSVAQGVVKGLGRQGSASWITFVGWWVIGIPLGLFLVFYLDWGLEGLWMGPTSAYLFNFVNYYLLIWKSDWAKIANEADLRRLKNTTQIQF